MKKITYLMIGMVFVLMLVITSVNAIWIQQITEQQFLNLNREQIINNLNIQCNNPYIQDGEIIYPCQINTIDNTNNEYWIVRESFYPKLDFKIVKYCLNNYQPNQCKNFLINNPNKEEVTINGETYFINPVQSQIIDKAVEIILNIEEMQENIIDEQMLELIQQQGGVTIPLIS